ncbi:MAG: hypothetical protein EOP07_11035 [Proteobacteria bacterium]|nr:MAG: hypothetical protein EOP07_11035 [Pseudomonadota bacterium]
MKAMFHALGFASLLLATSGFATDNGKTAGERVESGLSTVSEGTKEAARGVSTAASEAGRTASDMTQKVGRSIKAATCPVVGDRKTKLYYAADSKSYTQVLDGQKYFEDDDRSCFMTEQAARADGYTRSTN